MAATRWGCAGAAKIANDFFVAIKDNLPQNEHQFVSIAARDQVRAQAFADRIGFQKAYGSYQELADDPNVEVVYIGTISSTHYDLSEMMLKAGKHVICEKPMALNLKQVKKLHQLAKDNKLFYMEAVWSRFTPSYLKVREELSVGSLGEIRLVMADFCLPIKHVERMSSKEMGGGGILDIGIYTVQLACLVYDEMPERIVVEGSLTETGVDENACILLRYRNGGLANLTYHLDAGNGRNIATIMGKKGRIELDFPFHTPTTGRTPAGEFNFPIKPGDYNFINSSNLQYEAAEVRQCLLKGTLESEFYNHRHAEMVMSIMDEVRRQLGYTFPEDSV